MTRVGGPHGLRPAEPTLSAGRGPTAGTLSAIRRYPVKSCRGHTLGAALVEPWGLAGDRRWALVDPAGKTVTGREHPRFVLVEPHLTPEGLLVRAPGATPLRVTAPAAGVRVELSLWASTVRAVAAATEASQWFSAVLDAPVRLVYLADPTLREVDPVYAHVDDRVSLADGYPLLLTAQESLDALNDLVLERSEGAEEPLSMIRFRPNLVVTGGAAWAEDRWRRVRIGDAEFRMVKRCARCVFTTVDPDTGQRGKEPLRTLAKHRRWDGKTWFGVNLIPDNPWVSVRVGDPVEVLEWGPAPPPR
ncbi:MAG TPA: MOSC N-terminal beta barrel domain-containing protein [Pseudonocardia sp.]|nr:MOSC N-terminal beta barrel domain-containing protein [Pseudonocardia sp.]